MQVDKFNMRVPSIHTLGSPPNMRSHSLINSTNGRARIIYSRSRSRITLTLRVLGRIRSLDLGHRIRHDNKLVNSRSLKIRTSNRNSRSTLTRTAKRLIQMILSSLLNSQSPRLLRRISHFNRAFLLKRTAIGLRRLHSLITSDRSQIRNERQILRSRNSLNTTSLLPLQFQRNRRIFTIMRSTPTNSRAQQRIRGPRSHLNYSQLT